jgi:predicted DNA-binding protein (UPF0251 family)
MEIFNNSKLKERLEAKSFKKQNGCIEWTGYKMPSPNGYGRTSVKGKLLLTHRLAWMLHNEGPLSNDICVCHKCDNPACINPDHLFLGTQLENIKDRHAKGRTCSGERKSKIQRAKGAKGEQFSKAKLKAADIPEIVRLRKVEGLQFRTIAEMYGVRSPTIQGILSGRYWKSVTGFKDTRNGINI